MKQLAILALLVLSPIAFAHNCPNEMKAIDAELASTKVAGTNLEKAKALRAEGEKAHKDGKHTESMRALSEAKKILGI